MHARTTTVQARPSAVDDGVRLMRDEVMEQVADLDGSIGLSMVVDRQTGRCIITSAWSDLDAMRASALAVKPLRDRVAEALGAAPSVEEWEIAGLHRRRPSSDGACARGLWVHFDPARLDEAVELYRSQVLPRLEEQRGFCSASLLVDRVSGRCMLTVAFESAAALEATREREAAGREQFLAQTGGQLLEVAEFDLVLSELRVPETV